MILLKVIDNVVDKIIVNFDKNKDDDLEDGEANKFLEYLLRESGLFDPERISQNIVAEVFKHFDKD